MVTRPTANLSGNVAKCDKALEKLIIAKPTEMKAVFNGLQRKTVTWEHRAMGAFLFLYPRIYGDASLDYTTRAVNVAAGTPCSRSHFGKVVQSAEQGFQAIH